MTVPRRETSAAPVDAADLRAWAAWIRALRTDLRRLRAEGEVAHHTAAPAAAVDVANELLAAIDTLPHTGPAHELALPEPERLRPLVDHLGGRREWYSRLEAWGILATRRPPGADRVERLLSRHARGR